MFQMAQSMLSAWSKLCLEIGILLGVDGPHGILFNSPLRPVQQQFYSPCAKQAAKM
jgi:hypothetical protein